MSSQAFAGRRATVVIVGNDGEPLGRLPPIELPIPWWPDTADLLAVLREQFGVNAVVLRLIRASTSRLEPGADVTYAVEPLGQLPSRLRLEHVDGIDLGSDNDPLRMPWARLGGVNDDVAWADQALASFGSRRTGPVEQMRSWNLSLLLRMPTDRGVVWLKHVPPFMRHEATMIGLVREMGADAPVVLAADTFGRVLLEDVPGEDAYRPDQALATRMVESFAGLQQRMVARHDAMLASGCPNWAATALLDDATGLAARRDVRAELTLTEQSALDELITELPTRLADLYECGLRDTLVHGDFHPGNHRSDGHRLVLLDWGDSGVGHPLLDMAAFLEAVPPDYRKPITDRWLAAWSYSSRSAEVARAAALVRPIAAIRLALIYRRFLDAIEASEQVYHREDPATWLRRAIAFSRSSP